MIILGIGGADYYTDTDYNRLF